MDSLRQYIFSEEYSAVHQYQPYSPLQIMGQQMSQCDQQEIPYRTYWLWALESQLFFSEIWIKNGFKIPGLNSLWNVEDTYYTPLVIALPLILSYVWLLIHQKERENLPTFKTCTS
jgi:hypothetical protein